MTAIDRMESLGALRGVAYAEWILKWKGSVRLMGQCTCTSYRDTDELEAELVGRLKDTIDLSLVYNSQQLPAGRNQFRKPMGSNQS